MSIHLFVNRQRYNCNEMDKILDETSIKSEILSILSNLKVTDGVPDTDSIEEVSLKAISSFFKSELATPKIIREVIGDVTFPVTLEKVDFKINENKTILFPQVKDVDLETIVKEIFISISNLPSEYVFFLRISDSTIKIPTIILNNSIELMSLTDTEQRKYVPEEPSAKSLSALRGYLTSGPADINFKEGNVVLKISGYGYVAKYGIIKIYIPDPLYSMKAILGIFIALDIIALKTNYYNRLALQSYRYIVYESKNNKRIRKFDESMDDEVYIDGTRFLENTLSLSQMEKTLGKKTNKFEDVIEVIKKIFAEKSKLTGEFINESLDFQMIIKNTAYWYYESLKNSENHNRVVYLTTAFDSLLGNMENENEVNKEMKAEIIANVIAKDGIEAIKIKYYIKKLYILRNDIVHGKKPISSLEKYSEEQQKDHTIHYCVYYLSKFFASRIYFYSKSISLK